MFKTVFKNAIFLTVSNIFAKFLYLAIIVILARELGADIFGKYTAALNLVSIFAVFTMWGFDTIVVREGSKNLEKSEYIQNIFFPIRFYLSITVWILSIICSIILGYDIVTIKIFFILSLLILTGGQLTSGLSEHFGATIRIFQKMKYLSVAQVFRVTGIFISTYGLLTIGKLNVYWFSLILVIMSFISLIYIINRSGRIINNVFNFNINFKELKEYFKSIIIFGLVSIIFIIGGLIDIQLANHYLQSSLIGIYSAALSVVGIFYFAISSLQISFFPLIAKHVNDKSILNKTSLVYLGLTVLSIIFILLFSRMIYNAVIYFFGDDYINIDIVLNILLWIIPFKILISFINLILDSKDYYFNKLIMSIAFLLSIILTNIYFIPIYGLKGVALASLISYVVFFLINATNLIYIYIRRT